MRQLVKDSNDHRTDKSLLTAYVLAASPLGLFGAHHYYLDNVKLGLIYTFTVGIFGIGWLVDLFRMKQLVRKSGMDKKSVGTAYIMSLPPFGIFGAYHYYLGNYGLGILYTLTLGVFSLGWLVDLCRMKDLVKAANDPTSDHGTTKVTAYVLCVSPLGIFGAHHFFLKRYLNGGFYVFTLGLFGIGWIFDMFRLPVLFERFAADDKHKYLDEAYIFWFPFGIFGLHHFYLENKKWGILYACTFGCCCIGWIVDGLRMRQLISKFNKGVEDPDLVEFRICRPKCKISLYTCRRCCMNMCECCTCFGSFTLSKSESQRTSREITVTSNTNTREDFDEIRKMYPDEHPNPNDFAVNENQANDRVENNVYTVQNDNSTNHPNGSSTALMNQEHSAYPADAGHTHHDDVQTQSNELYTESYHDENLPEGYDENYAHQGGYDEHGQPVAYDDYQEGGSGYDQQYDHQQYDQQQYDQQQYDHQQYDQEQYDQQQYDQEENYRPEGEHDNHDDYQHEADHGKPVQDPAHVRVTLASNDTAL